MNKLIAYWAPVILWAGIIFWLSSLPDLKSELKEDFILRKIAHIAEFAILTFLLFRALSREQISLIKAVIFSFIFSLLYAISDEYHQTFIEGREGALKDVGIDSIGILITSIVCYIRNRKKSKVDIRN